MTEMREGLVKKIAVDEAEAILVVKEKMVRDFSHKWGT